MLTARYAFFYLTYFAGLGVMLPYFNLYFETLGLNGFQIGVLSAIVPLGKTIFPVLWAYRADRGGGRSRLTRIACFLTVLAFGGFLLAGSFPGLALACLALAMVDGPRLPMVEASSLDLARRRAIDYGRTRAWGSVGFIVSALVFGAVVADRPLKIVLYGTLAWAGLNWLASLLLPDVMAEPAPGRTSLRAFLRRPAIIVFFLGCMLMQASHGAYYAFFSIAMERSGYGSVSIGALWALGVMAEIVVMSLSGRIASRVRPDTLLAACCLLAAARWGMFAASAAPAVVIPAQILHAFTFGAFHIAAVTRTHRLFPADLRASGQSLYAGLTFGLGTVVGTFASGWLFDTVGPWKMYGVSGLVALLAALSLTLFHLMAHHGGHAD